MMKKIEMNGKCKVVALNAVKGHPEGYKGLDRIRTGLKLLKKLEKEFPKEGEVSKEILEKNFELVLEDVEINLLKSCVESIPWSGPSLEVVVDLCDALAKAEEVN